MTAEPRRPGPAGQLRPMKAVTAATLPLGPTWGYEVKWDGVRVLAEVGPDGVRLRSANGLDVTAAYPELQALAGATGGHAALLDGEVVALGADGRPDFGSLQRRMHVRDPREVARRTADTPVVFQVFDLLALDGQPLVDRELAERRDRLEAVLTPGATWALSPVEPDGEALLSAVAALGMEGVMAKRLDSRYEPGRRSSAWRKVKVRPRQELVVGGWAPGQGRRAGGIGALLLGVHDGGALRFAGRVGTGFTDAELDRLDRRLAPLATTDCPFSPPPPRSQARDAHWVEPLVVVEIAFAEWTADGRLRHPAYLGERDDKDPSTVVREG